MRTADALSRRHHRGFSLVELAIVVLIISVLVALVVPLLKRLTLEARASTVINDLRVFTTGFQSYVQERGDWPAGTGVPAEFPAGMDGYLGPSGWSRMTPVGGNYTWDPNSLQSGERFRAVIVISSVGENKVTSDRNQLLEIDRKFDDGNLDTGSFRLGFRNYPVYILEH